MKHGGTDTEMSFILVQRPERPCGRIKNRRLGLKKNRRDYVFKRHTDSCVREFDLST